MKGTRSLFRGLLLLIGSLFPVVVAFIFGADLGFYATTVVTAAFVTFSAWFFRWPRWSLLSAGLLALVILQVLVGAANLIGGRNDLKELLIYSSLGIAQLMAFVSGKIEAKKASESYGEFIILAIGLIGLAEIITRFGVVGSGVRSSLGVTFLFPYIIHRIVSTNAGPFKYVQAILLTLVFIVTIAMSGLRSIAFLGSILALLALYVLVPPRVGWRKRVLILSMLGVLIVPFISHLTRIPAIQRSITIVETRFQQTLLANNGIRLDPDSGRQEEAASAFESFRRASEPYDYLIGRGYGFTFADSSRGYDEGAHIHLTPVAYFLRGGVPGLIFYLVVLLYCARMLLRAVRHPRSRFMGACIGLWGVSSIFYGSIVGPGFWFVFAYIMYTRGSTNSVRLQEKLSG